MSTKTKNFEIKSKPYYERQLITIVDNEVKEAEIKANEEIEKDKNAGKKKPSDYAELVSRILISTVQPQLRITGLLIQLAIETIKAIKELNKKGIEILTIGASDSDTFRFPPGHPRRKNLYVAHPANPNVYFPFSDFHRLMFETKFSEAIILLMSLGAETINVEHLEGWGYEMSSEIVIPAQMGKAGAKVSADKKKGKKLLFSASLQPKHSPAIPNDLFWYHYEPTWKMIADGRNEYGLKEFSLNVTYKDDFGIGVKLKSEIDKAGFEIGSNFQSHTATVWNINGKFADIRKDKK